MGRRRKAIKCEICGLNDIWEMGVNVCQSCKSDALLAKELKLRTPISEDSPVSFGTSYRLVDC